MRVVPRLVAWLVAASVSLAGASHQPQAIVSRAGAVEILLPADLLSTAEVQEQLTNGLTTVFVVTGSARGRRGTAAGALKIEVRYELWEEHYLVSSTDSAGERKWTLSNHAALEKWWSEEPKSLIPAREFEAPVDVEVKLTMLPFSAKEAADTRRWLARTLAAPRNGDPAASGEQAADALRAIVETSIARRPLLVRRWTVRAAKESK